ncbi:Dolichyl-phosphate-mannose-protein mannosyltransferase [Halogranum amylolyticum]|uniref:Dolichyl-phosphate-mannose-protein mannosyltransferase n=1 Tax=Halogranum amylolyticum TaxID=660520 RepID=A0A1H8W4N7_9EURY|nr:glycosyltransferase family 39 protein [Halogranum amylolyticum]SEP22611.1 Dolichyl-phosphate-mannose-protein mannosyltransferase [Halogranum amylolyticum]
MSHKTPNSLLGMLKSGRLDIIGAVGGLLAAVLMLPLQLLASQVYIQTLPLVLGVASVLYLLASRTESESTIATLTPKAARLLPSLSVVGIAVLVALATFQGNRTLLYYDVAAMTGMLIMAQVFFTDDGEFSPTLILTQVVLLGLVVRLTALMTSPGYVGIDVWSHVSNWTTAIYQTQSLDPIANRKYFASPLFHLLVASAALLFDLGVREALFLSLAVAMPISVLFVYSTTKLLVGVRWAVFAAAAYAMIGHVVEWGIHLIPTSLGLIFFLAILYSLTRVLHLDYKLRDFVLVVVFSVAVILTHQISAFIMLVFTGAGLLAQFALSFGLFNPRMSNALDFSPQDTVNLSGLIAFDLGLITFMWSLTPYQGGTFLATIFSYLQNTIDSSAGFLALAGPDGGTGGAAAGPDRGMTLMQELVQYIDVAGFLLLLLLTIVGSMYVLRRENASHATFTGVVATVAMLVFVFGFPLFGIRTFVPGRWFAFLAAPMAVIAALGVAFLVKNLTPRTAVIVLLIFTVAFPTVTAVASHGTLDSPPFADTQTRYSYTDAELAATSTIGDIQPATTERPLHTDHPYQTVFDRREDVPTKPMTVANGSASTANETVVYRDYQQQGAAYVRDGFGFSYQPSLSEQQACSGSRDVTYTNGEVTMCTTAGSSGGGS